MMLPLLQHLANGRISTLVQLSSIFADMFGLTKEEREAMLPDGHTGRFDNRLARSKSYLERAGLIQVARGDGFRITPVGRRVLDDPPDQIDVMYLNEFPSFYSDFSEDVPHKATRPVLEISSNEATPPEEALHEVYQRLSGDLVTEILNKLRRSGTDFFQNVVVDLLHRMGLAGPDDDPHVVRSVATGGGFHGVIQEDYLGLDVIFLHAERRKDTVTQPEVQRLVDVLKTTKARKGIFITTSVFALEAQIYLQTLDLRMALIDGSKLAQLMIDFNVGFRKA